MARLHGLSEFLHRVAEAQGVNSVLQEMEPPFEAYRRAERALTTYIALAREHNVEPIASVRKPGTAIVLAPGEVHFYDDIYGYDAALGRTLAKGYPYPR